MSHNVEGLARLAVKFVRKRRQYVNQTGMLRAFRYFLDASAILVARREFHGTKRVALQENIQSLFLFPRVYQDE